MIESMRWFGAKDPVSLQSIRQAGATDIVSALLDIPFDQPWPLEAVIKHRDEISAAGLKWSVVESIPIHESIKHKGADADHYIDVWIKSLNSVATAGIKTVCYNFMPIIDWTRTNLEFSLANGATALRFDATAFAAFDLFILRRPSGEKDYTAKRIAAAKKYFDDLDQNQTKQLTDSIIAGLPGNVTGSYNLESFIDAISIYQEISNEELLNNLIDFQKRVVPIAEELGVTLAIHPDDPPRPLLGMPRAVSKRGDFQKMFSEVPSINNGLTWCLGSLSAGDSEDTFNIGEDHPDRIHFAHLRAVSKDPDDPECFQEAEHLGGDVSLVRAIDIILSEEKKRHGNGNQSKIIIRPDHGHRLADDLGKDTNPGYGFYGRMKGLAELRGVAAALAYRDKYK
ncbi:MAG: mannonate dehydratase [Kordiimonadaceae bacterium]|jgi:mannonate dehydratase|nr:mannonate dehydratase [Kordiimonadaceae bacterium]MBT6031857.1 mannonate dehydratase [Kordiimonadaceae bacterium]